MTRNQISFMQPMVSIIGYWLDDRYAIDCVIAQAIIVYPIPCGGEE
jgi:hypothetical protein